MPNDLVKAHLNLYAVLPNLEEVVAFDPEMSQLVGNWDITVEFKVHHGPQTSVTIRNGQCRVRRGPADHADVRLWFRSPEHLNAMFEGRAKPVPIKGFTRLGFMSREFPKLTDRLERYLRAGDEMLKDEKTFEFVTRCMLYTAVFGLAELAQHDTAVADLAKHTPQGIAEFKILPEGPTVHISHVNGTFAAGKGPVDTPNVRMQFVNPQVCNELLNGRIDAFAALGRGDVTISGFLPLADYLNTMLEYLEPYLK